MRDFDGDGIDDVMRRLFRGQNSDSRNALTDWGRSCYHLKFG
jgi:hypothetical protein